MIPGDGYGDGYGDGDGDGDGDGAFFGLLCHDEECLDARTINTLVAFEPV